MTHYRVRSSHNPYFNRWFSAIQQEKYNKEHGITPKTISKSIRETIKATIVEDISAEYKIKENEDIKSIISRLTDEMLEHAANMEFEKAAELRDKIKELEKLDEN